MGKRRIIPSLPPLFFQSERERERKREKERERERERKVTVNASTLERGGRMKTSEERAPPLDEKSFIETLSIDFISPTEIESIKKTQVDTVEMLQKASKKMDEFTQNSRENMVDTEEKLADADESLRNIAEDLRYIHRVCSRVKKGLKDGSKVKER